MAKRDLHKDVSFIIPVYNAKNTIIETIESVLYQNTFLKFEIIVVDDGSTDGSPQIVKDWIHNVKNSHDEIPITLQEILNQGEAEAINKGLNHAKGSFVAWVESDVCLDRDWLSELLSTFDNDNVMGAGGLLLPAEDDNWIAKMFGFEIAWKILNNYTFPRHITSANVVYRSEIFQTVGKMQCDLSIAGFDAYFNHTILAQKYQLRFNSKAKAWHHYKSTLWGCLKRTWSYGSKRKEIPSQILYPYDWITGCTVLCSSLLFPAIVLSFFFPVLGLGIIASIFFVHFFYSIFIFVYYPSLLVLLSAPVFLIRNIVFFSSYFLGIVSRLFR